MGQYGSAFTVFNGNFCLQEGRGEKCVSDNGKCIRTSEGVGVLTSD